MAYTERLEIDNQSLGSEIKKLGAELNARVSANVAVVATADGSDPATTQALANANKAKINELIAALVAAGLMAAS